jgi:small subunit ribosomal protein S35
VPSSRGRGRGRVDPERDVWAEFRALQDQVEKERERVAPTPKLDDETIPQDSEFWQEAREGAIEGIKEAGFGHMMPDETTARQKKLKNTFLNMGDPEPFEDEDFEVEADTFEDMGSLAHGELEHHREMRHYARLAAWEMPLLSSMFAAGSGLAKEVRLTTTQNLRRHSNLQLPRSH